MSSATRPLSILLPSPFPLWPWCMPELRDLLDFPPDTFNCPLSGLCNLPGPFFETAMATCRQFLTFIWSGVADIACVCWSPVLNQPSSVPVWTQHNMDEAFTSMKDPVLASVKDLISSQLLQPSGLPGPICRGNGRWSEKQKPIPPPPNPNYPPTPTPIPPSPPTQPHHCLLKDLLLLLTIIVRQLRRQAFPTIIHTCTPVFAT